MNKRTERLAAICTLALLLAEPVHAYIGPGAGITVIGTIVALIGAVILGIVGFIWYPVKRLRASLAKNKKPVAEANEDPTAAEATETDARKATDADENA